MHVLGYSAIIYCHLFVDSINLSFQMSMNVQQQRVAVSMLCVTIRMDHTSALVTQDILETDEVVQVILESLL